MMGKGGFAASVEKSWYKPAGWTLLLVPFSWVFKCLVSGRVKAKVSSQDAGFPIPIIVIGNLSVGGTGKTPLLIALVNYLKKQGIKPGVISRGFGGKSSRYPLLVGSESTADYVGDEPLLISQHCPVVVDPNRLAAAHHLIANCDCNLIISDDGLQHYTLPRDIEIVVVDGIRGFGNGYCLPAGPLREPVTRLNSADMVVVNGDQMLIESETPVFHSHVEPVAFRRLSDDKRVEIDALQKGVVHAVAGIGNPGRFVKTLQLLGFEPILHAYSDHHPFSGEEFIFNDEKMVIVTAKDAIKINEKNALNFDNVWVLDIESKPEAKFHTTLYNRIIELINH